MLNAVRITTRLAAMASPLTTADKAWIDDSDCALDDFEAQVLRDTDLADYPHAVDVRANVPVYPAAATSRTDRRACRPN